VYIHNVVLHDQWMDIRRWLVLYRRWMVRYNSRTLTMKARSWKFQR